MEIFRVEHKRGKFGPYQGHRASWMAENGQMDVALARECADLSTMMDMRHAGHDEHPVPQHDVPVSAAAKRDRWVNDHELCAFESIEDLVSWFQSFIVDLNRCGFHIVCYKVHGRYVKRFARQCVFDSRRAEPIREIELSAI